MTQRCFVADIHPSVTTYLAAIDAFDRDGAAA
jgi:hypothetical protein